MTTLTRRTLARLKLDRRGTSLMEFALAMPLLLTLGGFGIENAILALTSMRISQAALQLADNASRIGVTPGNTSIYQLREGDINDVLQGARLFGSGTKLTTYGRVTLSSLENIQQGYDSAPVQRIHWQRCIGAKNGSSYDSSYGTTSTTAGTSSTFMNAGSASNGMGDSPVVTAPPGSGVMFVEVNYYYRPLFGNLFMKPTKLHFVASLIVRDRRDFSQIYNPTTPAGTPQPVPSTCDKYAV